MPGPPAPSRNAEDERYSIDELSVLAGLTPRTVRYYIAEGLVDRPLGEKRGAHYVRRHLEQLLLVRRWTDAGLSLERVRELRLAEEKRRAKRADKGVSQDQGELDFEEDDSSD